MEPWSALTSLIVGILDRERCCLGEEGPSASLFNDLCRFAEALLKREREGREADPDSMIEVIETDDGNAP